MIKVESDIPGAELQLWDDISAVLAARRKHLHDHPRPHPYQR